MTKGHRLAAQLAGCVLIIAAGSGASGTATAQSIACTAGFAGPYACENVDLLARVESGALAVAACGHGGTGADVWGWTDPETGREYAVQALSDATAFVDVTNPTEPIFVGCMPAPALNFLWRDVKVYDNHAYVVGDFSPVLSDPDNPDAVHGLQIFDLTRLRGAAPMSSFTHDAVYTGIDESHNFVVNEAAGFGYAVASDTCRGMHMLDLKPDPKNPVFLGCFDHPDRAGGNMFVHDSQCVIYHGPDTEHQGKEICFNANEDVLDIVDVTDKSSPQVLSRRIYEGFSYVHQGWLTENHEYFAVGDETDELDSNTAGSPHNTHTYLYDVRDLDNPVQLPTYVGPTGAIDHNLYIRGRYMYQANYTAGLRIIDVADIANGNLSQVAFFDTHPPDADGPVFAGLWSNYPFFASGIVIANQIEGGQLFVLGPHLADDVDGDTADKATGGGWLASVDGGKINFGFNARQKPGGPEGNLQLNDQGGGVKIHVKDLVLIDGVQDSCGAIMPGPDALEFRGTGSFNKNQSASFRVCVVDNGEPGSASAGVMPDRFHLVCVAGCGYSTGARAGDDGIDGGNIQVHRRGDAESADTISASTVILDPLLLDAGSAGALQLFEARVYGANQQPLANAPVTLSRQSASGDWDLLEAVSGLDGKAFFSVTLGVAAEEFLARAGNADSNAVRVKPLLP